MAAGEGAMVGAGGKRRLDEAELLGNPDGTMKRQAGQLGELIQGTPLSYSWTRSLHLQNVCRQVTQGTYPYLIHRIEQILSNVQNVCREVAVGELTLGIPILILMHESDD